MAESNQPRQGMALNFRNASDPFGICNADLGFGLKVCNNIEQSKGIKRVILTIVALVIVFLGDFFDIFSWFLGLIPIVGDILGNSVFGNIIDAIGLVALVWLIGGFALIGIGEFVDLFGFVPVIGDIASVLEWLPAWLFALVIYGIYLFLKERQGGNILDQGQAMIRGIQKTILPGSASPAPAESSNGNSGLNSTIRPI